MYRFLVSVFLLFTVWRPVTADTQEDFLRFINDHILVADSQQAVDQLGLLQSALQQGDLAAARERFSDFILSWKKVETAYVAGALDEDLLDHPRYIDYYHQGNESIAELVRRALQSEQPISVALFKNSTKGINALEYLLFSDETISAIEGRKQQAALLAVNHIMIWLEEIADFYAQDTSFIAGGDRSLGLIVNRLIDSSYKLTNWRVGEAGGLVKKYQGQPDAQRLEYHRSGLSLQAIKAILSIHLRVINNADGSDLMAVGAERGVSSEMSFLDRNIKQVTATLEDIVPPLKQHIEDPRYQQLFRQLDRLHKAYYFMLIDALGLNASIIDADGD